MGRGGSRVGTWWCLSAQAEPGSTGSVMIPPAKCELFPMKLGLFFHSATIDSGWE